MPNSEYYPNLSDRELLIKIKQLTPHQQKMYEKALVQGSDERQALFVASSYPMEDVDALSSL
jgi:hypothetical protein